MSCKCPNCGAVVEVRLDVIATPTTSIAHRRSARGRFGLSKREAEVADLIVEGCTNQDIADELKIAVQVIKNYTSSIFDKVGSSNRADLVRVILLGREADKK